VTADDIMGPFMAQVRGTSWVMSSVVEADWSNAPKMTFKMQYLRLPHIYIDGPQEQFLSRVTETLDRNARGMHLIGGGGVTAHGRHDWTGERIYEWFLNEPVGKWEGRQTLILELPQHLLELLK
jgi:hypothetical protein